MSDLCPSAGADSRSQEARGRRLARRARVGCVLTLLAAGAVAPTAAGADDAAGSAPAGVVVVFERGVPASQRAAVRGGAHARVVRTLGRERFQLLKPAPGQSVEETVAELRRSPAVAAADPNVSFEPSSIPNDARFNELWGLLNTGQNVGGGTGAVPGADIDATLAWDRTVGDPSTVVADIDSGYFFGHPDLGPVAWANAGETPGDGIDNDGNGYVDDARGWDFFAGDNDATDDFSGHGIHTAGTIGAKGNNGIGVTGVAQNSRIMPLRVCGPEELTEPPFGVFLSCPLSRLVEAMNYAGGNDARAANMSLNQPGVHPTLLAAEAANQQTLFVVSAGNDGTDNDTSPKGPCYDPTLAAAGYTPPPGTIDNVVCVAATDQADGLAFFSNFGAQSVDLGAPGTETLSTKFETETVYQPDFSNGGFDDWTTPSPPASDSTQGWTVRFGGGFIWSDLINPQAPGTTRAAQTPAISVPAEFTTCTLSHTYINASSGDDAYSWRVFLDGVKVLERTEPDDPSGSLQGHARGDFSLPASPTPHTVTAQFQFDRGVAGSDPAVANVGELRIDCYRPVYSLDSGTSMAAPHVTGTAALLFSLKPSATVSQVRNALLAGVDPLPSLAGKTATGGRLNAWKALAALVPMDTRITGGPPASGKTTNATFNFDTNNTGNAGFQCSLDGGAFQPCTNPKSYKSLPVGQHTFSVRSAVPGGVDTTPATKQWTVTKSK